MAILDEPEPPSPSAGCEWCARELAAASGSLMFNGLQCVAVTQDPREIIGWVPPGAPGNASAAAFPIYGHVSASPPESAAERERRLADEATAMAEARERTEARRAELLQELHRMTDPIGRLLKSVWLFSHYTPPSQSGGGRNALITCDPQALRLLFPDLWPDGKRLSLGLSPPWDTRAIAAWFKDAVIVPPTSNALRIEKKRLLGYHEVRRPGWGFSNGSTMWVDRADWCDFLHVSVTIDGEVTYGTSLSPRQPTEGFNAHALRQMAKLCGLAMPTADAQPIPPRSRSRPYDEYELMRLTEEMRHTSNDSPFRAAVGWVDAL